MSFVAETVTGAAPTPLNEIESTPARPLPLTVTSVPSRPEVGEKLEIFGCTWNEPASVVPPAFVTITWLVDAVGGTTTVSESPVVATLSDEPETVPNRTAEVPLSVLPVIVTRVPVLPAAGVIVVIVGLIFREPVAVVAPPAVVSATEPVSASSGTVSARCVASVAE